MVRCKWEWSAGSSNANTKDLLETTGETWAVTREAGGGVPTAVGGVWMEASEKETSNAAPAIGKCPNVQMSWPL